jgi:anti-sigma factor RsiW
MRCSWTKNRLANYRGGELHRWENLLVQHHLKRCDSCQAELENLNRITVAAAEALRQQREELPRTDLWPVILPNLPKVAEPVGMNPTRPLWQHWPSAAALAAAAVLIILLIGRDRLSLTEDRSLASQQIEPPAVEEVFTPNTTVMTIQTEDPKVRIVWLFQDDSKS